VSQPWILADEQSSQLTRIATAPKRIGLRSHIRLSGVLIKLSSITLPDSFNASSA
jgi:hypothetical protein